MQELVLKELKIYIQDTTSDSRQNLRSMLRKPFKTSTGSARLSNNFIGIYSKRDANPLNVMLFFNFSWAHCGHTTKIY